MYRVFEALDELVTIVEEARGLPMTASCVVPRGDVLELLDDVRDALPGEVDDAQDVLDHRDQMIGEANATAAKTVGDAQAEAHRLVSTAQADAERDRHRRPRRGGPAGQEATAHAEALVARAQDEAARIVAVRPGPARLAAGQGARRGRTGGRRRPGQLRGFGRRRPRRTGQAGLADRGRAGRVHRVGADPGQRARRRRPDAAGVRHLRRHARWASIEETLTTTLRTIGRGRTALRTGGVADFRD